MTLEITLVRHGQTDWNLTGQHTGRSNLPLNARGREESEALGARLAGRRFDRVFVSPLARARETCALAGYGGVAEPWDALMEWDYGAWEGRTKAEIALAHPGWDLWRDGAPSGESAIAMALRVDGAVARVRALEGTVALFAHGHFLRAFAARWAGWPLEAGRNLALSNCAISTLVRESADGVPQIRAWGLVG